MKPDVYAKFEEDEEKLYFPLDNITETGYIYNVSKEELQNSSEILTLMKDKIKTNPYAYCDD
mgnify:CR=1 FL=1